MRKGFKNQYFEFDFSNVNQRECTNERAEKLSDPFNVLQRTLRNPFVLGKAIHCKNPMNR